MSKSSKAGKKRAATQSGDAKPATEQPADPAAAQGDDGGVSPLDEDVTDTLDAAEPQYEPQRCTRAELDDALVIVGDALMLESAIGGTIRRNIVQAADLLRRTPFGKRSVSDAE